MMMTMMMMTTLDRSIRVTVALETRHSPMFWFRTVLSSHTRLMKSYDRRKPIELLFEAIINNRDEESSIENFIKLRIQANQLTRNKCNYKNNYKCNYKFHLKLYFIFLINPGKHNLNITTNCKHIFKRVGIIKK